MKKIWISWEKHRRTTELVSALNGIKGFYFETETNRLVRYFLLLMKTLSTIVRERPQVVFVQNPSLILSLFMVTVGKTLVPRVVVDSHNEGLKPFHPHLHWLLPLYHTIQKRADLTLVTNEALAREVRSHRGTPFVLEDKIPRLDRSRRFALQGEHNLAFICTFQKDEPFEEVIRAASLLGPEICIYVTGKYRKAHQNIVARAPSNLVFTGFLDENRYVGLLGSCDVIIDLTRMQDCLVCGAYEALALEKPLILSNTRALRKYFSKGAVYTENRAEDIAQAIHLAVAQKDKLEKEIAALRREIEPRWEEKKATLLAFLDPLAPRKE